MYYCYIILIHVFNSRNIFFFAERALFHESDFFTIERYKNFQFSCQHNYKHTTTKRHNRWLRFLRLVSRNSPFKGVFPNPFLSDARTPPPPNPIDLHGYLISCKISGNRGRGNGRASSCQFSSRKEKQGILVLAGQGGDRSDQTCLTFEFR